jgi:hypothetical protein
MIGRRRLALALSMAAAALPLCGQDLTVVSKTAVGDRPRTSTQYKAVAVREVSLQTRQSVRAVLEAARG